MKRLFLLAVFALTITAPIVQTGCKGPAVTLEAGGVYSDAFLAVADQYILDASKAMDSFIAWHTSNAAFLAQWPEVGKLASDVSANRDTWIRNAYAARDSYASVLKAYRDGKASQADVDAKKAAFNAAIAVINNITAQINAYRSAHAN